MDTRIYFKNFRDIDHFHKNYWWLMIFWYVITFSISTCPWGSLLMRILYNERRFMIEKSSEMNSLKKHKLFKDDFFFQNESESTSYKKKHKIKMTKFVIIPEIDKRNSFSRTSISLKTKTNRIICSWDFQILRSQTLSFSLKTYEESYIYFQKCTIKKETWIRIVILEVHIRICF